MKYLWQDLNKITSLLKNSPAKALILDFDGTLTPLVKLPKEAKLSKKKKNLLQKLSAKKGVYLAILSGRKLLDIKEKINLPNIIYGGNHGLEGEIFGEKYSFPLTNKMTWALGKTEEKLKEIVDKFKGVFIENKDLTLSFHYRLANKQEIPQILSLVNKILKPIIATKLISTVTGEMVIDIIPKVKCDKGHFVALAMKKITALTKTHPLAIIVGDDNTDEYAFQNLKKEITIVVGNKFKSKARYYLKNTQEVDKFLKWFNNMI